MLIMQTFCSVCMMFYIIFCVNMNREKYIETSAFVYHVCFCCLTVFGGVMNKKWHNLSELSTPKISKLHLIVY